MEASLYVHVPFCAGGKCDYCDFYSVPVNSAAGHSAAEERFAPFIDTLLAGAEGLFAAFPPEKIPSVYIGGGTPSVLGPHGISRLLTGLLRLTGRFSPPPEEVTVEANPESADEAFLAAAREAGASRLSLGVQSFHRRSREAVHRIGADSNEALLHERLSLAAKYFPGAFSADLLSGLPFQNEKIIACDIDALLSHKPAHVSLYALTIEDGTALAGQKAGASFQLPEGDEADALWLCGRDLLEKEGYSQYEVSNFCLAGKESIHNIRYWRMENWLALGPSASGTIIDDEKGTGLRYVIPRESTTIKADGAFEALDAATLIKETILMGFRYINGPDEDLFRRRFKTGIENIIPKTLNSWRSLLQYNKPALSKDGLLLLNRFLLDAFDELMK